MDYPAQPVSDPLFERACRSIPGGVNSPVRAFRSVGGTPFFTARADGATLTTADGRTLIDFVCTWGPAIHGHNHPAIREAVHTALEAGTSFGTPNPREVDLAETILAMVPSIRKVRLCNSGTEATMSAIRLARGFTGRDRIIKFSGCYHGHVDSLLVKAGSGAATLGNPDSAGVPADLAQHTTVIPYNDREALAAAFADTLPPPAALIVEPYPANQGFILPEAGFLEALREHCDASGTLLIFDEVMTGFRISESGVQGKTAVEPDLTCLGKIIGGGLPVGAFGGRADIMDHLAPDGPVYQAGTLSGNPLAMAAGQASLDLLREQQPYAELHRLGTLVKETLEAAGERKGLPLHVIQDGSMFCLSIREERPRNMDEVVEGDKAVFNRIFHFCLKNGVYLPPSVYETCFISTAHSGEAIEKACMTLDRAVQAL
ncbi:MAG: glutamate-1-semialdehyde 2,1-aminomutase [Opitutales bacterium]